jgi:outer membrane protein, heavy metal efflux system
MMFNTKPMIKVIILITVAVSPFVVVGQDKPVLTLDSILHRIDKNNVLLQSYALRAEGYKHSAEAATAWMPPMAGIGTFMTPYPFQKLMESRDRGAVMLRLEQEIPNASRLNAKKRYIASQANIENATRSLTLNDLKAEAKRLYYSWLIAGQRIKILRENERIMTMMKKIEEVRYPYNQSQLGSVYQADAKIAENANMISMQEGEIAKARAWLNSLMNQPGDNLFSIDSTYTPRFSPSVYDTSVLASVRGDVLRMDESIRSMQLNIESMKEQRKPDFRIQLDHMHPLTSMMPKSFSVMGMITIPIAPWSSKMYKSDIKGMQLNIQAMEKERAGMLQETQGMLYGMQYQIQSMQKRIDGMEKSIIPALQKALDANFLTYQENKLPVTTVISSWEALTMMQMNLLDEKLSLYQMIVDYEKELYK